MLVQQLRTRRPRRRGATDRRSAWSLGAAGVVIASVLVPLVAGAAPLVVLVIGFLVTAALGLPLAFTLALTSLTYLLGIGGVGLIILPIKILGGVDSFVLLAIPLFILAGALMESGGISERIVDLAMAIVGRVRGGLAMVAVVAEILFSGISGSTAADVSAISSLLVPSMRRAGYSGPESVSVVAAASAMGILVPPCLTMVVLGIAREPVDRDALPGGVRAGVHPRGGAARADRDARAAPGLAGDEPAPRARTSGARSVAPSCRSGCRSCSSAGSSAAPRPSPRRRSSPSSTRWSPGIFMGGIRRAEIVGAARAERDRHRDDAVGAGRGVGLRVDPGARVGPADAGRVDRRRSAPDAWASSR